MDRSYPAKVEEHSGRSDKAVLHCIRNSEAAVDNRPGRDTVHLEGLDTQAAIATIAQLTLDLAEGMVGSAPVRLDTAAGPFGFAGLSNHVQSPWVGETRTWFEYQGKHLERPGVRVWLFRLSSR